MRLGSLPIKSPSEGNNGSVVLKTIFISKEPKRKKRLRLLLILAISFVLIMVANLVDYGYILRTQDTVNSVYEDRVVAQDYIYHLSGLFHKKELYIGDNELFLGATNDSIVALMSRFEKTKLTQSESDFFIDLKKNFMELTSLEDKLAGQKEPRMSTLSDIQTELLEIRRNLDNLEGVQFTEGGHMTQLSNRALGMNTLLSHVELVFLVIIGFIVMYIVLLGTHRMGKVN